MPLYACTHCLVVRDLQIAASSGGVYPPKVIRDCPVCKDSLEHRLVQIGRIPP